MMARQIMGLMKNSNFGDCSKMIRYKVDSKLNEGAYIRVCSRFGFTSQYRKWMFFNSPILIFFLLIVMSCFCVSCGQRVSNTISEEQIFFDANPDEVPELLIGPWLSDDVVDNTRMVIYFYPDDTCNETTMNATAEEIIQERFYDYVIKGNKLAYGTGWKGDRIYVYEFLLSKDQLLLDGRVFLPIDDSFFEGK